MLAEKDFKLVMNDDGPTITTRGKTMFRVDIYDIATYDRGIEYVHAHVPAVATTQRVETHIVLAMDREI